MVRIRCFVSGILFSLFPFLFLMPVNAGDSFVPMTFKSVLNDLSRVIC